MINIGEEYEEKYRPMAKYRCRMKIQSCNGTGWYSCSGNNIDCIT